MDFSLRLDATVNGFVVQPKINLVKQASTCVFLVNYWNGHGLTIRTSEINCSQ
jgi:hypothetical protein